MTGETDVSSFLAQPHWMSGDNKFFALLKVLLRIGAVRNNAAVLSGVIGASNRKRLFALALFAEFENERDIEFFAVKSNSQFWIHSLKLKAHPRINNVDVIPGYPGAAAGSDSIAAAFIGFADDAARLSFEIAPAAPQHEFWQWKLKRAILSRSKIFTEDHSRLFTRNYDIASAIDFADMSAAARQCVEDFILARNELLQILDMDVQ
jgi:hypothetical protein